VKGSLIPLLADQLTRVEAGVAHLLLKAPRLLQPRLGGCARRRLQDRPVLPS
jgi:hypothetical protein